MRVVAATLFGATHSPEFSPRMRPAAGYHLARDGGSSPLPTSARGESLEIPPGACPDAWLRGPKRVGNLRVSARAGSSDQASIRRLC